ncbi:MAG TPA: heparan-alpha-glucosaminide N-acetyltransferase [Methanospirillum sp.]|jgi:uncharacterized membrane protein|uniref:heparan-alpha-glucosaminide N-acetyltransferase n=1 Tax=Methanospirillum sp. TaxID=45200 RepID=UPI0009D4F9C2|nr:heparan-alpha-glucosaminide N-acetyltransferase [Methanospirillum sp.]OQB38843.1 MAG: hypothetical protein BWY05_00265 [Euryarchaeota archaeon ADurb.Bin165]HPY60384.1 heparan-alpha-glucosaminide N-acetyltransferase [Methanospirillum sp.]HQB99364.1 heparan-alpha-glucosaminide N-acetyltransferase [Methanospirillum sp.]
MGSHRGRYPELDACRGIAILMMILFHFFVDLAFLGLKGPDPFTFPLRLFGLLTAISFVGIAGVSAHLKIEKIPDINRQISAFLRRGGELILIGAGITIITWFVMDGEGYVVFGILHLIGTALILAPLLYRSGYYGLLFATVLIIISLTGLLPSGPLWLAWSGICPDDFYSVDYTPLIPWLSVFILGLYSGRLIFPSGHAVYAFDTHKKPVLFLAFIGRQSLFIYLVHQPVLFILIMAFTGMIK